MSAQRVRIHGVSVPRHLDKRLLSFVLMSVWIFVASTLGADERRNDSITIELETGGAEPCFVVGGASKELVAEAAQWTDEEWQRRFPIYLLLGDRPASAPLLGDYSIAKGKLRFSPRYPLRAGVTYRVSFLAHAKAQANRTATVSRDFIRSSPALPATRLTEIFPSSNVVPENLLKFYLHFSAPMSRGEVYRRVKLIDSEGKRIEYPFLELAEELWSPDGKRLTLYFDPGRIKRGLKPRELFGPALLEGRAYRLEVDAAWPDANGQPLAAAFKKEFRTLAPDDEQPNIKQWKVETPAAGSREPLTVLFKEPLDSAMLERVMAIQDAQGKTIEGEILVSQQETRWTFQPKRAWVPGSFAVVVATTLEDLAGNSLGRPFEVDVFRPAPNQTDVPTVTLPFVITDGTKR